MALKSTIFKAELQVADVDRHHYADYSLTLARHPSETDERMMVRLLAFGLFAAEGLRFGRGLSDVDEPDLLECDLTGRIAHWVEVGLPDERAILRAAGRASRVSVVAYGGNAVTLWWASIADRVSRVADLAVLAVEPEEVRALATLAERTMRLSMTIQEQAVLIGSERGVVEVHPRTLRAVDAQA